MSTIGRILYTTTGVALILGGVAATPAAAGQLTCGQVVTSDTSLTADLFCPSGDGLIVQGRGITLDLNGHAIRGRLATRSVTQAGATGDDGIDGHPYTVRFTKGQFAGIRVRGVGNTVKGPGVVKHFAAGVVVQGGSGNTVTGLRVEENLGPPGTNNLGDGILVRNSEDNSIVGNTVRDNGPFDGIVLLGDTEGNLISGNLVADNSQPEICPTFDLYRFSVSGGGIVHVCGPTHPTRPPYTFINQQNHGIKLEGLSGFAAQGNVLADNTVTGSGNTGIFIPSTCPDFGPDAACQGEPNRDNLIEGNHVVGNGFGYPTGLLGARLFEGPGNGGNGITLMIGGPNPPIHQMVRDNVVNENARNGIIVQAHRAGNPETKSAFVGNTALRNNALEGGAPAFNGHDGNAIVNPDSPCDSNVWRDNNFGHSAADIGGPVPPNDLTNHPCVGPVLTEPSPQTKAASASSSDESELTYLSGRT